MTKHKIVIFVISNHAPNAEQTSPEAKFQLASELMKVRFDEDLPTARPEECDVVFQDVSNAATDWIKAIPGDATFSDVIEKVHDLIKHLNTDDMSANADFRAIWFEGVSSVAVALSKYNLHFVKAHSERVSIDLGNGQKKVDFQHRRFWVY